MTVLATVGSELERWVQPTGYLREELADGFALSDGETRRILQRVGDSFVVSTSQRGGRPKTDMSSEHLDDAVRYLVASFGDSVRQKRVPGAPRLDFPSAAEELAAGFELGVAPDNELNAILTENGRERARFRSFSYPTDAVQFSHYCRVTVAELEASFLDASGKPLFPLG